jgi:hypothetical protein
MDFIWVSILLVVVVAVCAWFVVRVFRAGVPTGESSSRADTFASGPGYGADDLDTLRSEQRDKD